MKTKVILETGFSFIGVGKSPSTLFLSCALVFALYSCIRSQPPQEQDRTVAASLRLKWLYDPGFAGEMVADKAGFFVQHGLRITIKPGGFEADPIKLVGSNSDTFGVTGADSFLLARAKGVPIVAFAAGYIQTPVVFYVRAESKIYSPTDFVGHRVGYQAGQDTATIYEALLRKTTVDRRKIIEVPVRYDFSPFLTGQVDVWPGYAATQSYILETKHIPYRIIAPSTYGLSFLGTVYFTNTAVLQRSPHMVQAFLDAVVQGWTYTYSGQSSAVALISAFDPKNLTPELIKFNLEKQKPFILPPRASFCVFTTAEWDGTIKTLHDLALLPPGASFDLNQIAPTHFIDRYLGHNNPQ